MSIVPKDRGEQHSKLGSKLRDFILGWQDGMVNVLGLILGVASATQSVRLIMISGLAAAFAEAISMAAVAYTSTKAELDFYNSELEKERREIRQMPEAERQEIREIYFKKGFRGSLLEAVVRKVTSNKKVWTDTMMQEELKLSPVNDKPKDAAVIVLIASLVSPMIPMIPFLFFPIISAIIVSFTLSVITLFVTGAIEARLTIGNWKKRGLEMVIVGTAAAVLGYLVGKVLGAFL